MEPLGEVLSLPADAVEVGRITGPWGIKGWVRVHAHAAVPEALFSCRQWWVGRPGHVQRLRVSVAKEHGDGIVAQLHEVSDRSGAEALKGTTIWVPRSAFPTPDADEYYWVDLMGLAVVNREGVALGVVSELFSTGPHSVMRVVDGGAAPVPAAGKGARSEPRETLIPFVSAYVDAVQMVERCIRVDWPADWLSDDEGAPSATPTARTAKGD